MANINNRDQSGVAFWHQKASSYKTLAASGQVKADDGILAGIMVAAAASTPTIKIWDAATATGTVIVNTFTPVAGTFYDFKNLHFTTACYVTISGTVACTVLYK